jgi:hypothetical protein
VQRRAEEVVGRTERVVTEGSFPEREVLQVRVSVAADIVEGDESEKPFGLDSPGWAILPEEASKLFVTSVIFVVLPVGRAALSSKLAEVFLGELASGGSVTIKTADDVGRLAVGKKNEAARCAA